MLFESLPDWRPGRLTGHQIMSKAQTFFSTGRGPHPSRRGLLRGGLAVGTLALGGRAALAQHLAEPPASPA